MSTIRPNWSSRSFPAVLAAVATMLAACASAPAGPGPKGDAAPASPPYIIGPGDTVQVFVWRNPELSATVPVRPDGKITTPLVEDLQASGKTPTQLARDMEQALSKYIKSPIVTVIVTGFVGRYSEQVRVVGEAAQPRALPYKEGMTLLDVMIAVAGSPSMPPATAPSWCAWSAASSRSTPCGSRTWCARATSRPTSASCPATC